MRKMITILCLLATTTSYAQLTDSTFYGNIKGGMLKGEYDRNISETRVRIMNDEYALIPTFHKGEELTCLDIQSEAETLADFSVIEKKLLSLYEVISTKYGRANTLSLISQPESIPDGGSRAISSWDLGEKRITIAARKVDDKYVAVCNIYLKGYEEKLADRDIAREQRRKREAGTKF
jgi:hypothetical protein